MGVLDSPRDAIVKISYYFSVNKEWPRCYRG